MAEAALTRAEALLDEMSAEEQLTLLERVVQHLRGSSALARRPRDLRGMWARRFPADLDYVHEAARPGG